MVLAGGGATGEAKTEAHPMQTKPLTRLLLVAVAAASGLCLGSAFGSAAADALGGMISVSNSPILCGAAFSVVCGLCAYGVARWRGR